MALLVTARTHDLGINCLQPIDPSTAEKLWLSSCIATLAIVLTLGDKIGTFSGPPLVPHLAVRGFAQFLGLESGSGYQNEGTSEPSIQNFLSVCSGR